MRLSSKLTLCLVVLAGCGSEDPGALVPDGGAEPPTYYQDIAPLVHRECGSCHAEGGIGPFRLDTYEQLEPRAELALAAMQAGTMPPWMPDPSCNTFEEERILEPSELALFERWVFGGMPLGDPDTAAPLDPGPPPFEPTHVGSIEGGYVPDPSQPDDYRCFLLDFEFDRDLFLSGSTVWPDSSALVHHVLVYALGPDQVAMAEDLDAAEEGPGYTCFGGPIPSDPEAMDMGTGSGGLPTQIGAWVPGQLPNQLPEGHAIPIEAGSRVVMQVHYNLLSAEPEADATQFAMTLTDEAPAMEVTTRPLPVLDLSIPAGDPEVVAQRTFVNYRSDPLVIQEITGHMHLLGTELRAERVAEGGDECMLDIPAWDFDWQQSYSLPPDQAVVVEPGEGIRVTCEYDNSPENQPVVNGEQVEPRDVTWGEGTLDEMCLLYLRLERPYQPRESGPEACDAAAQACLASCDDADVACLLDCEQMPDSCRLCVLQGLVECGRADCAGSLLAGASCVRDCATNTFLLGGSTDRCLQTECPSTRDDLVACMEPVYQAGTCQEPLAACGIGL